MICPLTAQGLAEGPHRGQVVTTNDQWLTCFTLRPSPLPISSTNHVCVCVWIKHGPSYVCVCVRICVCVCVCSLSIIPLLHTLTNLATCSLAWWVLESQDTTPTVSPYSAQGAGFASASSQHSGLQTTATAQPWTCICGAYYTGGQERCPRCHRSCWDAQEQQQYTAHRTAGAQDHSNGWDAYPNPHTAPHQTSMPTHVAARPPPIKHTASAAYPPEQWGSSWGDDGGTDDTTDTAHGGWGGDGGNGDATSSIFAKTKSVEDAPPSSQYLGKPPPESNVFSLFRKLRSNENGDRVFGAEGATTTKAASTSRCAFV